MDDLIVIILTLVLIVASALGQFKKKPQENKKVDNHHSPEKDDLWMLPGEKRETGIKDKPVYIREQQVEEYKFRNDFATTKPIFPESRKIKKQTIKKTEIKFSLRDALIYNEIINRKYT